MADDEKSYCKSGPDCDISAWSDGDHYFIKVSTLKEFSEMLDTLSSSGWQVPWETFERIDMELQEAKAEKEQGE